MQMCENAFLDMVDLGYIKIDKIEYKNEIIEIATIGLKSVRMVKDIGSETTKSIYNSSSDPHDLEHSNFIFNKFDIKDIQENYRSEKELKALGVWLAATDGAFIYDDQIQDIYIETSTQHYTNDLRKAHQAYASRADGRFIENKVRVPKAL